MVAQVILGNLFQPSALNKDKMCTFQGRSGDTSQLVPAEYFRLEQLMEEFDFLEEEEFKANRRFQLLELRDGEVQEFRNYKMVPAYEKEIPRDAFTVCLFISHHLSGNMRFPTMWHFDMNRLRRACAVSF